jgi:hypothetical protein
MNTLTLTDTLTAATALTFSVADYALFKAWYRDIQGFDAYDTAKWAQRTERACHGDRTALSQLEDAGFSLQVQ